MRSPLARRRARARLLGGAQLPLRKYLDQFFRKMPADCFQVFGRIAGQQDAGPFANLSEAPEFVEKFQNYFGMKRRTELIGHAEVPPKTKMIAFASARLKVPRADTAESRSIVALEQHAGNRLTTVNRENDHERGGP
jgi:hypothetical protein